MKKFIALILTTTMIFTGCSSNTGSTNDASKETSEVTEQNADSGDTDTSAAEAVTDTDDAADTEAAATDLAAEKEETADNEETADQNDTIEITIPALYMDGATQEELDQDYGTYATATLNEDGSVTFVMSKAMHGAFVEIIGTELTKNLDSLPGSTDFPNVTAIETNADFTEFNLQTTATELSGEESMSALYVYMLGKMYNFFNQTDTNTITVNYINTDSGEIIYTNDPSEMDALIESAQQ